MDPQHLAILKGSWRTGEKFSAIEPGVFPCASEIELFDGNIQGGYKDCEWDQAEVFKFLGNGSQLTILFNYSEFKTNEYG